MKYIDAEKLKRFVESIGLTTQKSADYNDGRDDVKRMVLDFIDSLQQEQPEVNLKEEIRSMWEKCNPTDEGMGVESAYMHIEAFDIIARHFYNLGLNARKKENK